MTPDWRVRALEQLLRVTLVIGSLVAVPSVALALVSDLPAVALTDALALLWIAVLTIRRSLPYRVRAYGLLLVALVLGIVLLSYIGPVAQLYLLMVPAVAVLLLGARGGVGALVVSTVALVVAGIAGDMPVRLDSLEDQLLLKWAVIGINFALVGAVITMSTALVLRNLEAVLERQRETLEDLQTAHRELAGANDDLVREVARRLKAEQYNERLAKIVEQESDAMIVLNSIGFIEYSNSAADQLRGVPHPDPGTAMEVWLPDTALRTRIQDLIESAPASADVLLSDPPTGTLTLRVNTSPLSWGGAAHACLLTLRDVTAERARDNRERHLERLSTVGALTSGVAHDFNNVIAGIIGFAERLRVAQDQRAQEKAASDILEACERARAIVRQLLAHGRQEDTAREPINVAAATQGALDLVRVGIPSHVELRDEITSAATIVARASDIHQLILNLTLNAAQAMDEHPGTVLVRVWDVVPDEAIAQELPPLVAGAPCICLEVADDGRGIPDEDLATIFEPFITTRGDDGGTGLGLAIVHGIVAQLGGAIEVSSEVGVGTTFRAYLPTPEPSDLAPAIPSQLSLTAPEAVYLMRAAPRVMVIDDEPAVRQAARVILERGGYDVSEAMDGLDALAHLKRDPVAFALVICDVQMPGLSGSGLIAEIRAMSPGLPVLIASGNLDPHEQRDLENDGRISYLAKPYTRTELLEATATTLR